MANKVGSKKVIILEDGTRAEIKSLPIKNLRRFMDAWEEFQFVRSEDDGFDVFIHCAGIGLERSLRTKFEDYAGDDGSLEEHYETEVPVDPTDEDGEKKKVTKARLVEEYKEYLEENLDMDTIYEVLEVCGGLKLNDPKLMAAAQEMQMSQSREAG